MDAFVWRKTLNIFQFSATKIKRQPTRGMTNEAIEYFREIKFYDGINIRASINSNERNIELLRVTYSLFCYSRCQWNLHLNSIRETWRHSNKHQSTQFPANRMSQLARTSTVETLPSPKNVWVSTERECLINYESFTGLFWLRASQTFT